MKPLVLISSDDLELYLLLKHILQVDGFVTALADTPDEAIEVATRDLPSAVVLDCRPGSAGAVETCAALKQNAATQLIPIAALISSGAERLHAGLLKAGADEILSRPVTPGKLLEFLRGTLDHAQRPEMTAASSGARCLRYGGIEMGLDTRRVTQNGHEIHLSPIEFRLLRHMLQNPGQVFSRRELIDAAWPESSAVEPRTIDVHIARLRRAMRTAADAEVICTVRTAGYALRLME